MINRTLPLALIAALTLGGAAFAQEATDGAATEGAAEPSVGTEFSTGEEVTEGNRIGETYVTETVGDWTIQCLRAPEGQEDPCQLYQLLTDSTGNAVAEVSVFRLPEGGDVRAGATFIVPLETLLTSQLTVSVDGGKAKRYPYSFCNQIGCYARVGLLAEDVSQYQRGAKAVVTLVPFAAPDQTVSLEMSLTGFTAGLEKASVIASR
ncbi:invasion associated locus B family protein [Pseudaestuariivita sp.]|uniref:invasion associated locus B family protein n=1 Tax=Pseudaestuariivita sp. TaxID=2211669 RepID=UPI004057E6F2